MDAEPAVARAHLFIQDGEHYAYDPGSNRVIRVDAALRAALASGAATDEIRAARVRDGLFLPATPELVSAADIGGPEPDYVSGLRQLTLSLSERCNLRCAYCPHTHSLHWVRPHGDRDMAPATAARAVDFFLEHSRRTLAPSISLYGGEPLLAVAALAAEVDAIRRHGRDDVRLIVDTNGLLLTDETIELLVASRAHLQVSLDGPAGVHDRWRRDPAGRPTHAAVLAGLARLLERDPDAGARLRYQVTLMPGVDLLEVSDWFDPPLYGASLGVGHAGLAGIDPRVLGLGPADTARTLESIRRAEDLYTDACADGRHAALSPLLQAYFDPGLVRYYHAPRTPQPRRWVGGANCAPGLRRLHVRVDGRFQPCERVGEGMIIGDVATGLDAEAVRGLQRRFHAALAGRCAECWARRQCTLCFAGLAVGADAQGDLPESLCTDVRAGFEHVLRLWVRLLRRGPRALDHLQGSVVT